MLGQTSSTLYFSSTFYPALALAAPVVVGLRYSFAAARANLISLELQLLTADGSITE